MIYKSIEYYYTKESQFPMIRSFGPAIKVENENGDITYMSLWKLHPQMKRVSQGMKKKKRIKD